MAGLRKRKHASVDDAISKQTTAGDSQQGIKAFGSISKPSHVDASLKKRKTAHQRDPTPPPPPTPRVTSLKPDNKRKRGLDTVQEDPEDGVAAIQQGVFKQFSQNRDVATPRNKRFKVVPPPSPADTPSKSTAALFGKLKLDATSKAIPFVFGSRPRPYDTPPHTPEADKNLPHVLPTELEDVIHLHSAFLSALSLYYAHNGTTSPVNVKVLLPLITKHWKKRTVNLDDLRLILAVAPESDSGLILQDFGKAGICLTKSQPRGRATKRAASYVDEADLNARFESAMHKTWTRWLNLTPKENRDAAIFIHQLPLAEIRKDESVEKAAPMFVRGQQRLANLKASQATAKSEPNAVSEIAAEHKTSQAIQNRGTSLLDRILAKQALTASLPSGPTKEQLERKAALHRVEDIARVLELLAGGRPRCSFSMQAMVQQLKQSLRNPISKEEVERCLGLMVKEITPEFVNLVQSGTVTGVVVTKAGKVGLEELRLRVQRAGA